MSIKEPNGDDTPPGYGALRLLEARTAASENIIRELRRNAKTAADGVLQLAEDIGNLAKDVKRLDDRVTALSVDLKRVTTPPPPPLPPMRPELPSSVSPRTFAEQVKTAAIYGEKTDGTTPEAQVEAVLERVDLIRKGRLFNKVLWLALSGLAGLGVDRVIVLLQHH